MSTRLDIIYWRDIPAQVTAGSGRDVHRIELPGRFQEAIDRVAQREGVTGSDAYLAEWRKERRNVEGEPTDVAHKAVEVIELEFSGEVLDAYVTNQAWKP